MKFSKILILPVIATLSIACSHRSRDSETAKARLLDRNGEEVGIVKITEDGKELKISGVFSGLEEGAKQGFHVHEVGECVGDFKSAKGHFNPDGKKHGSPGDHSHAGDLGNIATDSDGTAEFTFETDKLSLNDSTNTIIGKSLIIHSGEDDFKSQPSGDSGSRYACGIIMAIR